MGNICSVPRWVLDILWEVKSMTAGDVSLAWGNWESKTHLVKIVPRRR